MAIKYAEVNVGDEITQLEKKKLSREQIIEYGYASGDENPIHMSDSEAWKTGLKGVIAHGLFFIAFMQQALTDWADNAEAIKDIDIKMVGSVRAGDNIISTARITNKYDSDKIVELTLAQFTYTPLYHARVILTDPDIAETLLKESLSNSKLNYRTSYEFKDHKIVDIQMTADIEAKCIKKVIFLSFEEGAVKEWTNKDEDIEIEILDRGEDQIEYVLYRKRQSLAGKAKVKLQ
ncbi:MAG: hypothetical protein EAX96_13960 [Candidatus Lokiarchaeota archaeon]|nr:hypothetical protein [Candidatus Lokiarchaeota archaeon]